MEDENNHNHLQEHRNHIKDLSGSSHIQENAENMPRQKRYNHGFNHQRDNILEIIESLF